MADEEIIEIEGVTDLPVVTPPPFEPLDGEPSPWSVPPPGGFAALKASLFKGVAPVSDVPAES